MEIITIRMDTALKARLLTYCEENDRSVSNTVRIAIRQFLEEAKK